VDLVSSHNNSVGPKIPCATKKRMIGPPLRQKLSRLCVAQPLLSPCVIVKAINAMGLLVRPYLQKFRLWRLNKLGVFPFIVTLLAWL